MTDREFLFALARLGLSPAQAAVWLDKSRSTIDAYCLGGSIPMAIATLLRVAAGLGGVDKLDQAERDGRAVLVGAPSPRWLRAHRYRTGIGRAQTAADVEEMLLERDDD